MAVKRKSSQVFPEPCSTVYGDDQYGRFMDLSCRGVKYTFRWIRSDTFWMGSPEEEPGRWPDRETLHQVTLTQGFWLGESTVTQALWKAVVGGNPSRFKGPDRPVDSVSWDDAQAFITIVNGELDGFWIRLPSEAEWEYACRALTTTPFSFGSTISPEQVNFDGRSPYSGGKKGLYRKKTLDVKSLAANPWGLYQMHGNVWEWCQDWYGSYSDSPITDPEGARSNDTRVLRGGSWDNGAGGCRSAFRFNRQPHWGDELTGFRLAGDHVRPTLDE